MTASQPERKTPVSPHAYLVLAGGVLSLGLSPIFIRWADAPGTVTSMYRMAIAACILTLPFLRTVRRSKPLPLRAVMLAVGGGFFFALDIGFWATGVKLAGATNPTLLDTIAPLWVGLFSLLLFKKHLGKGFWVGLSIALAGAAVILGLDMQTDLQQAKGALLGLLGGVFYGGYVMFIERARVELNTMTSFWLSTASSALFLLLFNLAIGHPLTGYGASTVLAFLGAGLLSQIGGFLSVTFSLGYLPSTIVAPALLIQPVATALFAFPLLGERLRLWQITGGAAVLFGLYLIQRGQDREDLSPVVPS